MHKDWDSNHFLNQNYWIIVHNLNHRDFVIHYIKAKDFEIKAVFTDIIAHYLKKIQFYKHLNDFNNIDYSNYKNYNFNLNFDTNVIMDH